MIRALAAIMNDDFPLARTLLTHVDASTLRDDPTCAALVPGMLGSIEALSGDMNATARHLAICRTHVDAVDVPWIRREEIAMRSLMLERQGQLRAATTLLNRAFAEFCDLGGPQTMFIYRRLTNIYLEWGDTNRALDYARRGIRLGEEQGIISSLPYSHLALSRVLFALGDIDAAYASIGRGRRIGEEIGLASAVHSTRALKAWTDVIVGDLGAARDRA